MHKRDQMVQEGNAETFTVDEVQEVDLSSRVQDYQQGASSGSVTSKRMMEAEVRWG